MQSYRLNNRWHSVTSNPPTLRCTWGVERVFVQAVAARFTRPLLRKEWIDGTHSQPIAAPLGRDVGKINPVAGLTQPQLPFPKHEGRSEFFRAESGVFGTSVRKGLFLTFLRPQVRPSASRTKGP